MITEPLSSTDSPLIRHGTHKNEASNNCIVAYEFIATVTFLSEPLSSKIHMQTHKFKEDTYEVMSLIWAEVPCFIKNGSGIQTLIGVDTETYRQKGDCISLRKNN